MSNPHSLNTSAARSFNAASSFSCGSPTSLHRARARKPRHIAEVARAGSRRTRTHSVTQGAPPIPAPTRCEARLVPPPPAETHSAQKNPTTSKSAHHPAQRAPPFSSAATPRVCTTIEKPLPRRSNHHAPLLCPGTKLDYLDLLPCNLHLELLDTLLKMGCVWEVMHPYTASAHRQGKVQHWVGLKLRCPAKEALPGRAGADRAP